MRVICQLMTQMEQEEHSPYRKCMYQQRLLLFYSLPTKQIRFTDVTEENSKRKVYCGFTLLYFTHGFMAHSDLVKRKVLPF